VQIEAFAHAAGQAITQCPLPAEPTQRRAFARIYPLVTRVANDTIPRWPADTSSSPRSRITGSGDVPRIDPRINVASASTWGAKRSPRRCGPPHQGHPPAPCSSSTRPSLGPTRSSPRLRATLQGCERRRRRGDPRPDARRRALGSPSGSQSGHENRRGWSHWS
jgi:hypothetical protein